jgi:hypothetical protein
MRERLKKRLGEILIEDGVLSRESLEEALNHQKNQGGFIGQILIKLGYLSEENLIAALSRQLNIPYLCLANYSINIEAAARFTEENCRRNTFIVFDQDERHVFIGVADPLNESIVADIEQQTHLKPQVYICTPTEILSVLDIAFSASYKKKEMKKAG